MVRISRTVRVTVGIRVRFAVTEGFRVPVL